MGVRRILTGALTAPLLLLPLLTACGGGGDPVADPPVSSAPPSSSPTQTAREPIGQFVKGWFAAGTAMQNSGDATSYLALTDSCADCQAVVKAVRDAYRRGGYYKTQGMRSVRVADSRGHGATRSLTVRINAFPTAYKTSANSDVQRFQGGPATFEVDVKSAGISWLVTRFVQVAS